MPSAAMLDKSTQETTVPTQLCLQMIEKKTRNLEKRKGKLDNLRNDVTKGKELNEDQKQAVGKYEEVLSLLDFAKDMYKSMNAIFLESSRQTKRQAKKEQMERQQLEIQRLQEALIYVHILSCFQNEDVRSDFLNGEHGAVQLTSEQLSQLDQLYKLIGPGVPADQADLVNHFHAMAENYIFLVEGRRKEIVSTTYKVLKDLLLSIKDCGYFSRSSEQLDNGISSDELPEDENANKMQEVSEDHVLPAEATEVETVAGEAFVASEQPNVLSNGPADITAEMPHVTQSAPLQEVLATQGSFNFLQESQIDLDAPHMDPAVVAVHPMAPPTGNFALNSYATTSVEDASPSLMNGTEPHEVSGIGQVPVMAPVLASADFDPSHPIPTQTFTNQSFAVMQNMIMPQYVPVTMHHGPLPPHITPIAVVPGSPVASAPAPVVPLQVPVVAVQENAVSAAVDSKAGVDKSRAYEGGKEAFNAEPNSNDVSAEPANEGGNGYPHNRNNFRGGRGRGRGNGYFRGRGNFYNGRGGGGGYQDRSGGGYQDRNRFYQDRDRNGYNGNFRRDNNRGPRGNGNNRGRGNYNRTQGPEGNYNRPQGPPQQQQQPQQAQQ